MRFPIGQNSNLGPILPRFRDIAGFLLIITPPRILGCSPWIRWLTLWREDPKLITRVINFELVQPICPRYINVTDRRKIYIIYIGNRVAVVLLHDALHCAVKTATRSDPELQP